MLGGSLSRCLKCGLLVGGAGCRGMGSPLGRALWSRRLIRNAPARKQLRLGIPRPFVEAGDLAESSTFPLDGSSTREPDRQHVGRKLGFLRPYGPRACAPRHRRGPGVPSLFPRALAAAMKKRTVASIYLLPQIKPPY
jgi:hypothetical protein